MTRLDQRFGGGIVPNSSFKNASLLGGRPRKSCQCMSAHSQSASGSNAHLERIQFLSAAAILENLVAVLFATSRIQRIGFEHRGCKKIHLVRQVATGEWTWMYGPYMSAAKTSEYVYLCERVEHYQSHR